MESETAFADTGIPLLFRRAYEMGADKRRMVVAVAGGSQMMDLKALSIPENAITWQ